MSKESAIELAAEALDRVEAAWDNTDDGPSIEDMQEAKAFKNSALAAGATIDEIQAARKN
ncbi:hypothetical protein ADK52_25540 [Streptomyces sp. WM6372]|uniref:hypothetical protein n=1 Tax=Streptomyces sp. WM6372 TaxID=1415555 RepID=UPI0006AE6D6C|nr:hypothetical protein [Streptomyces sp. WM6372]KOU20953.1 hypothetical protein ADK52_25540 [Streptomyces sp. WM6372]